MRYGAREVTCHVKPETDVPWKTGHRVIRPVLTHMCILLSRGLIRELLLLAFNLLDKGKEFCRDTGRAVKAPGVARLH